MLVRDIEIHQPLLGHETTDISFLATDVPIRVRRMTMKFRIGQGAKVRLPMRMLG